MLPSSWFDVGLNYVGFIAMFDSFTSVYSSLSIYLSIYLSSHQFIAVCSHLSTYSYLSIYLCITVYPYQSIYLSCHLFIAVYSNLSTYSDLSQSISIYLSMSVYNYLERHCFQLIIFSTKLHCAVCLQGTRMIFQSFNNCLGVSNQQTCHSKFFFRVHNSFSVSVSLFVYIPLTFF